MPDVASIPKDLDRLARLNAVTIRDEAFHRDVDAFVGGLGRKRYPLIWFSACAVAAAVVLGLAWKLVSFHKPDPGDFKLKLEVKLNKDFGPVDNAPEMKLAHRKPKERGINLLSPGASVGERRYEYDSPVYMPNEGEEYLGYLHRTVYSGTRTEPRWDLVCFVRAARSLTREPIVRLGCEEGGACKVAPDDFGWVRNCAAQPMQSDLASLLPLAFAQSPPTRHAEGWVVPALETLQKEEAAARNPNFTKFVLISGPFPALSKAVRISYSIRVNGTNIYIDGMPQDTDVVPFDAQSGVRLSFGLENLDFSGINGGYEDVEVTLGFSSEKQVIRRDVIHLRYVALRPMPETAASGNSDLAIRWRAEYHPGKKDNKYQIFLLSTQSASGAMDTKRRIDAAKLPIDGDTLVGVVRPPLPNYPWYGVALGVSLPSGQVKFTFDDERSVKLCRDLARRYGSSALIHGTTFRRAVDNVNLSQACKSF
jgi:hypothetical protein